MGPAQRSRARIPPPAPFLPVEECFLAILDKEVLFERYEYKVKVKSSNSQFKLFLGIINLRVEISLDAIEKATFY
jgi:hypothetical protein